MFRCLQREVFTGRHQHPGRRERRARGGPGATGRPPARGLASARQGLRGPRAAREASTPGSCPRPGAAAALEAARLSLGGSVEKSRGTPGPRCPRQTGLEGRSSGGASGAGGSARRTRENWGRPHPEPESRTGRLVCGGIDRAPPVSVAAGRAATTQRPSPRRGRPARPTAARRARSQERAAHAASDLVLTSGPGPRCPVTPSASAATPLRRHAPPPPRPSAATPLRRHAPPPPRPPAATPPRRHAPPPPRPSTATPPRRHTPLPPRPSAATPLRRHAPPPPRPSAATPLRRHAPSAATPPTATPPTARPLNRHAPPPPRPSAATPPTATPLNRHAPSAATPLRRHAPPPPRPPPPRHTATPLRRHAPLPPRPSATTPHSHAPQPRPTATPHSHAPPPPRPPPPRPSATTPLPLDRGRLGLESEPPAGTATGPEQRSRAEALEENTRPPPRRQDPAGDASPGPAAADGHSAGSAGPLLHGSRHGLFSEQGKTSAWNGNRNSIHGLAHPPSTTSKFPSTPSPEAGLAETFPAPLVYEFVSRSFDFTSPSGTVALVSRPCPPHPTAPYPTCIPTKMLRQVADAASLPIGKPSARSSLPGISSSHGAPDVILLNSMGCRCLEEKTKGFRIQPPVSIPLLGPHCASSALLRPPPPASPAEPAAPTDVLTRGASPHSAMEDPPVQGEDPERIPKPLCGDREPSQVRGMGEFPGPRFSERGYGNCLTLTGDPREATLPTAADEGPPAHLAELGLKCGLGSVGDSV
ncbi:nascent polypeptide-associated complex subunit alpha, muscle-specific form-like [Perognathus longimembris pacificus]|uniref:nascent polypeptide-associated complex subunit alpha, muscle-specific form-like n=1 Tax=Perognathus longimembris pacificus TaxID=214514 RepID=UPI00201A10B2|nr:nascent polypeptide-associated complex subunit alpha, muscle-specific form-like [Perognathus longimembris pacificus]